MQDVLDHDHGQAVVLGEAADQVDALVDFRGIQAGQDLIEQAGCEVRPKAPARVRGACALPGSGCRPGGARGRRSRSASPMAVALSRATLKTLAQQCATDDVFVHGERGKRLDDLEGSSDPHTGALRRTRRSVTSCPSNTTLPAFDFMCPLMILNSVVLPAPLGPIRPTISPGRTSKLTLLTATRPPKRRTRPSIRMRGEAAVGSSGVVISAAMP